MSSLLDEALKEKYMTNAINDPLAFAKDAIDWSVFPPLLKNLYHNDTDKGGRPNIPIITMVKVLFLQSMFNMVDEQTETLIRDRISFMNFLDYPDLLPDAKTIWYFRERLSKTGRDRIIWNELQRQLELKGIKVKKGSAQDATLYLRQISDIVEELESTSITILAFSSFVRYVPLPTISSPLE